MAGKSSNLKIGDLGVRADARVVLVIAVRVEVRVVLASHPVIGNLRMKNSHHFAVSYFTFTVHIKILFGI